MRIAIVIAPLLGLLAGCEEGPGATAGPVNGDRDIRLVSQSHADATPVRLVAFESGTRDERFVRDAASSARMQVELGRVALRQGQDARVKQFARQMIDDYQRAERDLLDVAVARDISIPPGLIPAHRSMIGEVTPHVGAEFDREYARMMVGENLSMVREYDEEARSGLDPQARDFAERTLPTMRDHLEKARALANARSVKVEDEEASVPGAAREAERASPSPHD